MNKLILGMVMVAILVVCSAPTLALKGACAVDSENRFEVVVPNGSYTIQWSNSEPPNDFNVPNELYWVGVYSSAWMPTFPITATWNGHQLPANYLTSHNVRKTGCGTTGFWFDDETGNTTPDAINKFTASNGYHGTSIPIIYTDPDNPNELRSWFYQSYDDVSHTQGWVPYSFHNVTMGDATSWTLMFAVTCADSGQLKFNGDVLTGSGFCDATKWTHVAIHDVTGKVRNGVNTVEFNAVDDVYTHPYWMWLVGTTDEPDLVVTEIDAGTPRPDHAFTVNATVRNQGTADAPDGFNVCLYVDSVLHGTKPVAKLNKGDNTTVSFTGVGPFPEGCYELRVVADVYDEVYESDELNNKRIQDHQVGYVIVVESDSDFTALIDDWGMPYGSVTCDMATDTYYIQNLTITNCAGDGIFISGTTKNFVIKNCTIENCMPDASGVFLNYVNRGTITLCTLRNNDAYGVELGLVPLDSTDPKFINITGNNIYQNGMNTNKSGIDLIGTNCTVAYNRVINNGAYGIYVYGNDNKIHNNIIEDHNCYGIKLCDSSGNHIYRNDLSNNSDDRGVQGYDNTAANTWRTPTHINYCYSGMTYYGYTGNYWDDYAGSDPDGDGIGTDAYALDGGAGATDSYPAMVRWRLCGDVNRDGRITPADAAIVLQMAVRGEYGTVADVSGDNSITSLDALMILQEADENVT